MTALNSSIDWITLTAPLDDFGDASANRMHSVVRRLLTEILDDRPSLYEPIYIPHYKYAIKDTPSGVVVAVRNGKDASALVQFSGSALAALGRRRADVLEFLKADGFRPSRVDVAFDLREGCNTPLDVMEAWVGCVPPEKQGAYSFWNGAGRGDTFYIGSRQSDTMWRIYDKAKESGAEGVWVRWEVEIKGQQAKLNGWELIDEPNMASVYLFRKFKDVTLEDLAFLKIQIASGEYTLQTPVRPPSDTARWMQGQVAKAFAKLCRTSPDEAANIITLYEEILAKVTLPDPQ